MFLSEKIKRMVSMGAKPAQIAKFKDAYSEKARAGASVDEAMEFAEYKCFGGAGSGNFNHSGRPGSIGGSGGGGVNNSDRENKVKARVMEKEGVEKVIIKKDGSVHAYGNMPRGDGGKKPWTRYEGTVDELHDMYSDEPGYNK